MHQLPIGGGRSGVTPEGSLKIVQSEIDNLDLITDLINKEKLDVDFWRGHLCEGTSCPPFYLDISDPVTQCTKPRPRPQNTSPITRPGSTRGKSMGSKVITTRG